MSIKKDFQNAVHDFLNMFSAASVDFFEALASVIAASGGELLRNAAIAGVTAAEAAGGNGEDKFKAAKEAVIAALVANGMPIVINAIHGAIEAAVAEMNKTKVTA